jgi:hypothetical protein
MNDLSNVTRDTAAPGFLLNGTSHLPAHQDMVVQVWIRIPPADLIELDEVRPGIQPNKPWRHQGQIIRGICPLVTRRSTQQSQLVTGFAEVDEMQSTVLPTAMKGSQKTMIVPFIWRSWTRGTGMGRIRMHHVFLFVHVCYPYAI